MARKKQIEIQKEFEERKKLEHYHDLVMMGEALGDFKKSVLVVYSYRFLFQCLVKKTHRQGVAGRRLWFGRIGDGWIVKSEE